MQLIINLKFLPYLLFIGVLISCNSGKVKECIGEKEFGNLDINTPYIETNPVIFDGNLYFINIYDDDEAEVIYYKKLKGELEFPIPLNNLKFDNYKITSTPSIRINEESNMRELYFSAIVYSNGSWNEDIFFSYGFEDKFTAPQIIDTDFNTSFSERNPIIFNNGNSIIFSADYEGGFGGFDLYISHKNKYDIWNRPKNLGEEINTDKDELLPTISDEGDLYFSSNGFTRYNNFDIIKSKKTGNGTWGDPTIMPYPINTEFDEMGIAFYETMLILSSNRDGGCGDYDLYEFVRCENAIVNITLNPTDPNYTPNGKLEIINLKDNKILRQNLNMSKQQIILAPGKYKITFENRCVSRTKFEQILDIACDDENQLVYNLDFSIPPPNSMDFSFEEYNVPFFVSGYYMPNTSENLANLKLKFQYNQMNADSVRFVENPENKYDEFAINVDSAFSNAFEYLNNRISFLSSDCNLSDEIIKIKITGFSDPRPIDPKSKYFGPTVDDLVFNFKIQNGEKLDNKNLSKLRAYYTGKQFQIKLSQNPDYDKVSHRIIWETIGLGVDPVKGTTYDYNRRVKIEIESIIN